MPMNTAPLPTNQKGLNLNVGESQSKVENPQNNIDVYRGSISSILSENVGAYVVVEFLIGTTNLVSKEGILYSSGNNFLTLYNDVENYYVVCDLYSVKFINFFDPRTLRRRSPNEIASLAYERDGTQPIYYTTVRQGETPIPPLPPPPSLTGKNNASTPQPDPPYNFNYRGQ